MQEINPPPSDHSTPLLQPVGLARKLNEWNDATAAADIQSPPCDHTIAQISQTTPLHAEVSLCQYILVAHNYMADSDV